MHERVGPSPIKGGRDGFSINSHNLVIVRPIEMMRILDASMRGDWQSTLILKGMAHALSQIKEKGSTLKPALCATCDHTFEADELPGPVVLQIPWPAEQGGEMIVSACCTSCGVHSDKELGRRVLKMIQGADPSTRVLDVHEPVNSLQ